MIGSSFIHEWLVVYHHLTIIYHHLLSYTGNVIIPTAKSYFSEGLFQYSTDAFFIIPTDSTPLKNMSDIFSIIPTDTIIQRQVTNQTTYLVGGLEHFSTFPYIGNVIIPIDELIFFQRGGPTTNQMRKRWTKKSEKGPSVDEKRSRFSYEEFSD